MRSRVRQAHLACERLAELRPAALLVSEQLRALLAIRLEQLAELLTLGDFRTLLLVEGDDVSVELIEDELCTGQIGEQGCPVIDLCDLDGLGGLQLFVWPHHLMGGHIPEVPR
jgi:hypothetical protein